MMKKPTNPSILHQTATSIIIALSDTEVGKVVLPSPYVFVNAVTKEPVDLIGDAAPTFEKEVAALQAANAINQLMPQFFRVADWEDENSQKRHKMIVMERLYPLSIDHFDLSTRQEMMDEFAAKMTAMHKNLFVHGDFIRPTNYFTRGNQEWMFQNIIQTATGLRLIDTGFSRTYHKEIHRLFMEIWSREEEEVKYFSEYYLK